MENPGKGIGSILNVAEEVKISLIGVKYKKIPLRDGQPIPVEKVREAIRWIREQIAPGKVLAACHYGVGRSASVVIAYLCSLGFGCREALEYISSKGRGVAPMRELERTIRQSLDTLEGPEECTSQ